MDARTAERGAENRAETGAVLPRFPALPRREKGSLPPLRVLVRPALYWVRIGAHKAIVMGTCPSHWDYVRPYPPVRPSGLRLFVPVGAAPLGGPLEPRSSMCVGRDDPARRFHLISRLRRQLPLKGKLLAKGAAFFFARAFPLRGARRQWRLSLRRPSRRRDKLAAKRTDEVVPGGPGSSRPTYIIKRGPSGPPRGAAPTDKYERDTTPKQN